jgi:hypothetical protein
VLRLKCLEKPPFSFVSNIPFLDELKYCVHDSLHEVFKNVGVHQLD